MELELTNGGLEFVNNVPTTLYVVSVKTDGTTYTTATIAKGTSGIIALKTTEDTQSVTRYATITVAQDAASDKVFTTTASEIGSFYSTATTVTGVSATLYNATFA